MEYGPDQSPHILLTYHAGALLTDFYFYEHIQPLLLAGKNTLYLLYSLHAVYTHGKRRTAVQLAQLFKLRTSNHLVCDKDVVYAGFSHDESLVRFGHSYAAGSGLKLHFGYLGELVRLGVRPQADSRLVCDFLHSLYIAPDNAHVNEQRRRIQLLILG